MNVSLDRAHEKLCAWQPGLAGLNALCKTAMDESLNTVIPDNPNAPYDMRNVITSLVDNGDFYEVHGWFVAYGPFVNPSVVVAVIVEQGGYGAQSAVPIGKKILEAAFNIPSPEELEAQEKARAEEAAKAAKAMP